LFKDGRILKVIRSEIAKQ